MLSSRIFYIVPIHLLAWVLTGSTLCPVYAKDRTPVNLIQVGILDLSKAHGFEKSSEPAFEVSPEVAGESVRSSILQGRGITIKVANGYLTLSAPVSLDKARVTTAATYALTKSPIGELDQVPPSVSGSLNTISPAVEVAKSEVSIPLEGDLELVANAAAFLGMAIRKEISTDQAEAGASIAMAGVNYNLVDRLIDSISGILTFDPLASKLRYEIDLNRFQGAIQAYNQMLTDSSDTTVFALAENKSFLEIRDTLKAIRSYLP